MNFIKNYIFKELFKKGTKKYIKIIDPDSQKEFSAFFKPTVSGFISDYRKMLIPYTLYEMYGIIRKDRILISAIKKI